MSASSQHKGARRPETWGARLRAQFGKPTGVLGWAIGHLMAAKNAGRSRWVLDLLRLRPEDRVLEIGFGSGADVRRAARVAARVAGIDHSPEMVRQATRRNQREVGAGRVALRLASAAALPFDSGGFDVVYSINAVQFWEDLSKSLAEVRRVLRPGGLAAIAIQPRNPGADAETTRSWQERLTGALGAAGFEEVRAEVAPTRPAPTVCVLARAGAHLPGGRLR